MSSSIKKYPNLFLHVNCYVCRMYILNLIWIDKRISWTKKLTPILHVNCDVCGFTSRTIQYLWLHLGNLINSNIKKNYFCTLIVLFVVSLFIKKNVSRTIWLICINYDLNIRFSVPLPSFTHLKCNIILQYEITFEYLKYW